MDSALKHRLLGAAVLIALAIIFVPMFFSSSPPRQDNTFNLSIPPAPERNFEVRTLTVDASTKTPTGASKPTPTPADPNKVASIDTGAPTTFEAPDKPAATTADKPAPAAPTTLTPAAATPVAASTTKPAALPPPAPAPQSDGRFVVSLGIYADAGGAAALIARVKKLGYPAFAEATEYQGKPAQRVRVGPYPDRAAAEAVRLKIKQGEDKIASSVVDLGDRAKDSAAAEPADKGKGDKGKADKPAEPAPTPALAANRAGAYAVQAGAFKSEEEANKLRDRLRNGGLAAFAEKGKSGDQVLWKVRAGPFVDKGGAETARGTLKQKFQIEGMIVTLP